MPVTFSLMSQWGYWGRDVPPLVLPGIVGSIIPEANVLCSKLRSDTETDTTTYQRLQSTG